MNRRRRFLAGLSALAGLLVLPGPARSAAPPFILGILPVHSLRTLVERYEPLRSHLERALKRSVRIESATDFQNFHRRTLKGDFDLVISPVHFARIAQADAGWSPLVQFEPHNDALLVHDRRRGLILPEGLRGKQLAVVDHLAITVMAGLAMLEKEGLQAERDFRVQEHRNHTSVLQSVLNGRSAAAITTSQGLRQVGPAERDLLAVYKHIVDVPAFVFMAPPAIPPMEINRLRELLLGFARNKANAGFFEQVGYSGLHPADEATLRRADPYLKHTRLMLDSPR